MKDRPQSTATRLPSSRSASQGHDDKATPLLVEVMYPELRVLATRLMRRERRGHTLQPTAIVNEAFLRLVDQGAIEWQDRAHFIGIAARIMRQILVDHARRKRTAKRGSGAVAITLDEAVVPAAGSVFELIALDDVLTRFAALDPRRAQVAELRVFGGLTAKEIAAQLGVSPRTVESDWAVARMWLARELSNVRT